MVFILYKKDTSPPCRSVQMVLHELGIYDVELIEVNLPERDHLKEEFLRMNPQHTVPTLIDGDFIIWDSHAIVTYLVNRYAKNDTLYPKEPKQRAIVDQRLHFDTGVLFAILRATAEPVLYNNEKSFKQENLEKMEAAYEFVEKFLTSDWLAGDQVTLADICCVSTISSMNVIVPIDKKKYPKIISWLQRCSEQEFYKKANEPGLKKFIEMFKNKIGN
ncbi:glutathione S-transferase epsilon 4 [Bombyx mori]|uniref:Epsilon-class glutathione transferase n=1 Tax=Bombyx mori TaxID=7091 RepID=B0LB16_BOMMO|nr:glutathione S-transferase epsilon 4 [Bombyx mori]ABS56977.1 glutathione S-transferase 9 [Bombyx mori]BAM76808.1 epsilon-class glutathione transferase [Bombyx mori]